MPIACRGQRLKDEFHRNDALRDLFLRYTQALITQMAQTAVCNRHHSVDQQLCRWLLLSLDRLSSNQLTMTQELIANMLGVRREGVTEAAGKLQRSASSTTSADISRSLTGRGWRLSAVNAMPSSKRKRIA
jgi:CRP-like cAMP-binding protein